MTTGDRQFVGPAAPPAAGPTKSGPRKLGLPTAESSTSAASPRACSPGRRKRAAVLDDRPHDSARRLVAPCNRHTRETSTASSSMAASACCWETTSVLAEPRLVRVQAAPTKMAHALERRGRAVPNRGGHLPGGFEHLTDELATEIAAGRSASRFGWEWLRASIARYGVELDPDPDSGIRRLCESTVLVRVAARGQAGRKVAIVTGAATGLGREIGPALRRRGRECRRRRHPCLRRRADDGADRRGRRPSDVSSRPTWRPHQTWSRLVEEAERHFGAVHVMTANAGILGRAAGKKLTRLRTTRSPRQ